MILRINFLSLFAKIILMDLLSSSPAGSESQIELNYGSEKNICFNFYSEINLNSLSGSEFNVVSKNIICIFMRRKLSFKTLNLTFNKKY